MAKPTEINEHWIERIREAVSGLNYGTVQIIVHDGRIVQIERTERFRFDPATLAREQQPAQERHSKK